MSNSVRVILYVALVILAGVSGFFALASFGRMMDRAGDRTSELEQIERPRPPAAEEPALVETGTGGSTNAANAGSNILAQEGATNQSSITNTESLIGTNTPAGANEAVATNEERERPGTVATALSARGKSAGGEQSGRGRMGLWTALFVVSLIGLGLLIANDVSHYFGNKTLRTLYNDDLEGVKNLEYEQAEEVWAKGEHLEAIGLMREYLNKNPREQHVAIRIAEIYEKDLKNQLAAALEYEEVLKHKLAPERWGWSAIHLCNLYFKLNQEQKGYDLLHRLVREYPETAAAEKGRKRLGQVEGGLPSEQLATESQVNATPSPEAHSAGSNLPPGFRPKK